MHDVYMRAQECTAVDYIQNDVSSSPNSFNKATLGKVLYHCYASVPQEFDCALQMAADVLM